MKFSLMFFASSEEALSGNKYQLILDSARFADLHGFSSLWVPERHFTEFGSLYPNPAVLQAALAVATSRLQLRAGSVVTPLHSPIRIAEEWSMVDNLSGGRIGVSFASGWNPDDFILAPGKYTDRQEQMLAGIRTVQHLWRGGVLHATNGTGKDAAVRIYPTPVQPELPVWITAAGNPQSFIRAGELGTHLLTHILDQDPEQLAQKIGLYREARSRKGFDPAAGIVTVMLHTFVGSNAETVREEARAPFCNYIRSNIGLLNGLARSRGADVDVSAMPPRALDEFVGFLYERFAHTRGLIGTPESCLPLLRQLRAIGVDEAACLLDFGPPHRRIVESLPHLARLRDLYSANAAATIEFDAARVQARCTECIPEDQFNEFLNQHGIQVEGPFRAIRRIWRRNGEALGEIRLPAPAEVRSPYQVHPAFLDACSRVLAAAVGGHVGDMHNNYLPAGAGEIRIRRPPEQPEAWSHATLRESHSPDTLEGDVRIYDTAGRLLIEIEALRLKRMESAAPLQQNVASLIYCRQWQSSSRGSDALPTARGEWLIVADRGGVGARLTDQLRHSGRRCSLLDARGATKIPALAERALNGVVYCPGMDLAPDDIAGRKQLTADILKWLRSLSDEASRAHGATRPRLWLLTAGAMPVIPGETICVAQAALWGLGRAIAIEHPDSWGGLIDLDPADVRNPALLTALLAPEGEDMLALRAGQHYVPRIIRADRQLPKAGGPLRLDAGGSYLITGGLGGLGLRLTAWLLERGAGAVALLGRSPPAAHALQTLHDRKVRILQGDVSHRDDVAGALEEIQQSMPPLRGVFHLAGTLDDARLLDQDIERFYQAGTGKAEGAWNLHELTRDLPLDHFVVFSSLASLVTTQGQGNYASANSVVDALAFLRRAQGRPALTVNWGPWAQIGHAATEYGRRAHEQLARLGVNALSPETSLAALERLMTTDVVQAAVIDIDWNRLAQSDPAAAAAPLLSLLFETSPTPAPEQTPLLIDLKARAPGGRLEIVTAALAGLLAQVLRLADPQSIPRTRAFLELGLDSILTLELTNRISAAFGQPFSATLLFQCPNLEALASFVLNTVLPVRDEEAGAPAPERPPEAAPRSTSAPGESDLSESELSDLILQEIGSR
jgi:phthiocerol/phenolphthiocerol synthesis type-I polyketide synthase D